MARNHERKLKSTDYPQLPAAPDGYPTFPDRSTWPVAFPELPPSPDGGPSRPPQHTSRAAAPRIPADRLPNHVAIVMDGNGRWATQRGLSRTDGHQAGEAAKAAHPLLRNRMHLQQPDVTAAAPRQIGGQGGRSLR